MQLVTEPDRARRKAPALEARGPHEGKADPDPEAERSSESGDPTFFAPDTAPTTYADASRARTHESAHQGFPVFETLIAMGMLCGAGVAVGVPWAVLRYGPAAGLGSTAAVWLALTGVAGGIGCLATSIFLGLPRRSR